jgi:hypothetical protein
VNVEVANEAEQRGALDAQDGRGTAPVAFVAREGVDDQQEDIEER